MQSCPTSQMQSWSRVGQLVKCSFEYLKCTFGESADLLNAPLRISNAHLKSWSRVGRLATNFAFGKLGNSRNAHLGSWRTQQMRIWEDRRQLANFAFGKLNHFAFKWESGISWPVHMRYCNSGTVYICPTKNRDLFPIVAWIYYLPIIYERTLFDYCASTNRKLSTELTQTSIELRSLIHTALVRR